MYETTITSIYSPVYTLSTPSLHVQNCLKKDVITIGEILEGHAIQREAINCSL
jgi:hypothetical protein